MQNDEAAKLWRAMRPLTLKHDITMNPAPEIIVAPLPTHKHFVDLSGRTFGRWLVDSYAWKRNLHRYWNCSCGCGELGVIEGGSLVAGTTLSCGCVASEQPSKRLIDLSGKRFSRWLVLSMAPVKKGRTMWNCVCDCGVKRTVAAMNLLHGKTRSCGCYSAESKGNMMRTHGATHTSEYRAWRSMKERCLLPRSRGFRNYGGRGIKVCDRWLESFENFIADMGLKPSPRHSIDRLDVNAGYDPSNCRWATPIEQANNKRSSRIITYRGITGTVAQVARELGMGYFSLYARIY